MSIALALQELYPDYKYRGSLTDENKEAFDALVDLSGIKPSWVEVEAKVNQMISDKAFDDIYNSWKKERSNLVDNIVVLYEGIEYQGDEVSQDRMARAILALPDDTTTITWTALDNSPHELTRVDLKDILLDAGTQQSAIWDTGRPVKGV